MKRSFIAGELDKTDRDKAAGHVKIRFAGVDGLPGEIVGFGQVVAALIQVHGCRKSFPVFQLMAEEGGGGDSYCQLPGCI